VFEIGTTLREARVRRGLEISDCEAATKIRGKYLRALEEERFDILPAPTYVRGFLRAYADFLHVDGQLLLDEYESRLYPDPPERQREPQRRPAEREHPPRDDLGRRSPPEAAPRRRRTEASLVWLAIGGVLAVALLVWLGVGRESSSAPALPTTPAPARSAAGPLAKARPKPKPAVPPKPKEHSITIVLQGQGTIGSWVSVHGRNQAGPVVFQGILAPGQTYSVRVRRSVWIASGNPGGLAVSVNGAAADLNGVTKDLLVTRQGVRPVSH
jgi:cytoskeletal protein RodZ